MAGIMRIMVLLFLTGLALALKGAQGVAGVMRIMGLLF